jgi:hypothetical protein
LLGRVNRTRYGELDGAGNDGMADSSPDGTGMPAAVMSAQATIVGSAADLWITIAKG